MSTIAKDELKICSELIESITLNRSNCYTYMVRNSPIMKRNLGIILLSQLLFKTESLVYYIYYLYNALFEAGF